MRVKVKAENDLESGSIDQGSGHLATDKICGTVFRKLYVVPMAVKLFRQNYAKLSRCIQRGFATLNENGVIEVGQRLSMRRTFTQADVLAFADLTGDHNPIHKDASAAVAAGFEKPLCHGMLYSSLPGTLFARTVPGSVYVSQTLNFKRPVYVDEEVEVVIEVTQAYESVRL